MKNSENLLSAQEKLIAEQILNEHGEGPGGLFVALTHGAFRLIQFVDLDEKLFTFLLSPFHGICNPSILNSEPTL